MILNGVYTSVWADEGECEMKMHKIYGVDKNICTAEKMLLKCGTGGMKMKKYELTNEYITYLGRKLYRIKALKNFGNVKIGELGGYIEKEDNLSQDGNAWVYGDARVCGEAIVKDNAIVKDKAWVCGNTIVFGDNYSCSNKE